MRTPSLRRLDGERPRPVRLVAFPYAGGGAHLYQPLVTALDDAELWAVEYPGHATRVAEPVCDDLVSLAEQVSEELARLACSPTVLLGYSMGALVAYEVARRLSGQLPLRGLIVCAAPAPTATAARRASVVTMDDAQFLDLLVERGGAPRALLEHPELLELALPILRADFVACERYRSHGARVDVPIVALRGARDPDVGEEAVDEWRALTTARFTHDVAPGDHLFLHDPSSSFPALVAGALRSLLSPSA